MRMAERDTERIALLHRRHGLDLELYNHARVLMCRELALVAASGGSGALLATGADMRVVS